MLDLSGQGRPGWTAEYVDDPTLDGSGRPVDLAGDRVLQVRVTGVVPPTAEGAEPWEGPEENAVTQSGGIVDQVVRGPLVEGTQQLFVGLGSAQPFRVFSMEDPARVVLDLYHPDVRGEPGPLPDDDPPARGTLPRQPSARHPHGRR